MSILQAESTIPLFVAGNHEHGATDISDGTEFPWLMAAGAANDEGLVGDMGRSAAAEARYAGFHLAFAPVIDLNYNFNNPITNVRSFGDQPEQVTTDIALYRGANGDDTNLGTQSDS